VAAYRLDRFATVGELLEAPEDPSSAHSGTRDEFAYRDSFRGRRGKRGPEYGIRICAFLGYVFDVGAWLAGGCFLGCCTRDVVQLARYLRVTCGGICDGFICQEVRASVASAQARAPATGGIDGDDASRAAWFRLN
jgi:hypothetical protein